VLVIDLNMPGRTSLEVIPEIREAVPATAIVVLTIGEDPSRRSSCAWAGSPPLTRR
jgi:DNA-binding NarL/FixJ family response regulator